MNPSKTLTAGLVGLLALGGSLGIGTQIAFAQADTDAPTGQAGSDGQRNGRRGHRGAKHAGVAELLGVDAETLREAHQNGTTLVELAAANGVSEQELIDALVARASARIDEKIAANEIDAADAAEKLADLETRIADQVNGVRPDSADDTGGERGPRGDRRDRGDRAPRGAQAPGSEV